MSEAEHPADTYKRLIQERMNLLPGELICPRERTGMTPCIARDGAVAVARGIRGEHCVGCNWYVDGLLHQEQSRHA